VIFLAFSRNDDIIDICKDITAHLVLENLHGEAGECQVDIFIPSGIRTKQYVPKGVMKLVLALSSSFM
jgi:hypothetical protein